MVLHFFLKKQDGHKKKEQYINSMNDYKVYSETIPPYWVFTVHCMNDNNIYNETMPPHYSCTAGFFIKCIVKQDHSNE